MAGKDMSGERREDDYRICHLQEDMKEVKTDVGLIKIKIYNGFKTRK